MLTLIWIIGIVIIVWPLLSGPIVSLLNGIIFIVSGPIYWTMRIIKRPKNEEEDDKYSNISTVTAFGIVVAIIFTLLII